MTEGAPDKSTGRYGGAALSPADVFIFTGGGLPIYVPAATHGLLFTDNITALEQTQLIPEPSSIVFTGLLLLAAIAGTRRRKRS